MRTDRRADSYEGPLVGQELFFDVKNMGFDFQQVFGKAGFAPLDVLTVIEDNDLKRDVDQPRVIKFKNDKGLEMSHEAFRFIVSL